MGEFYNYSTRNHRSTSRFNKRCVGYIAGALLIAGGITAGIISHANKPSEPKKQIEISIQATPQKHIDIMPEIKKEEPKVSLTEIVSQETKQISSSIKSMFSSNIINSLDDDFQKELADSIDFWTAGDKYLSKLDTIQQKLAIQKWNKVVKPLYEQRLSRLTQYEDTFEDVADSLNKDKDLIKSVFSQESRGNLRAISYKKEYKKDNDGKYILNKGKKIPVKVPCAYGGMQVTDATAKELGLKFNKVYDRRFDDRYIIREGAEYFNGLLKRYDQNILLALSAYNFGLGKVDDIIKDHGTDWDDVRDHLPRETRRYVTQMMFQYDMMRNPSKYDLEIKQLPLLNEQRENAFVYKIQPKETLSAVAKKYGVSVDSIEELNPTFKDHGKIPAGYRIFIPKSSKHL